MPQLKYESATNPNRLVIVSNRLPVVLIRGTAKKWQISPSSGGLVTALAPILRDQGGIWIGWPCSFDKYYPDSILATASEDTGFTIKPIVPSQEEITHYYRGFSNETLWPLFHDLPSRCSFDPKYWHMY